MEIDPENILTFQRPLNVDVVKCPISITNKSHTPMIFKIKTTAPKTYCVRPNSGFILPGESQQIQGNSPLHQMNE